ncbi:Spore germination protein YndE [compost metagenome]
MSHIPRQITTLRATSVIISTVIGVNILSFPRYMANAGGSGAPLVAIGGTALAFVGLLPAVLLCQRFPRENLFLFSRKLVGRVPADLLTAIVCLLFLVVTALTARQFGEVALIVLFRKTPIEAVILILLLLCLFASRRGVIKFAQIHFFYLPLIILPLAGIILASLRDIDHLNLLPVISGNAHSFFKGSVASSSLYQSSFIFILLVPFMKRPRRTLGVMSAAVGTIGILYALIAASVVGMFGAEETKLLFYPTLEAARSTSIGGNVLERLDALFIIIWVFSVFTSAYSTFYLSAYSLRTLLSLRDQRSACSFLLPVVFLLSLVPKNIFETYSAAYSIALANLYIMIYPLVLYVVAVVRKKRGTPQ